MVELDGLEHSFDERRNLVLVERSERAEHLEQVVLTQRLDNLENLRFVVVDVVADLKLGVILRSRGNWLYFVLEKWQDNTKKRG